MPVTSSEDLEAKAAELAVKGIASTSIDGRSVTVSDPLKILEVARRRRKIGNAFGRIGKAVVVPPGTTGMGGCS